jgi:hypothetical protein
MEQDTQSSHSDIALSCVHFSIYLLQLKDFQAAKVLLLKSMAIYSDIYSFEHRSVSSLLSRLGWVSQELGHISEAINYLQEAIEIKSSLYGTKHPLIGRDLNHLACLLSAQRDYAGAVLHHIPAIQSFQSSFGDHHLDTIHAYGNFGITLISQGDLKRGISILQEILYRFFRGGVPLHHPWIQRYSSYLKTLEHSTEGAGDREEARREDDARGGEGWNLLSLEGTDPTISSPSLPSLIKSSRYQTSALLCHHPDLDPSRLSVAVVDLEPFHQLVFSCSQDRSSTSASLGEELHTTKVSQKSDDSKKFSDENRLPYAALVLTE